MKNGSEVVKYPSCSECYYRASRALYYGDSESPVLFCGQHAEPLIEDGIWHELGSKYYPGVNECEAHEAH